MSETNTNDAYLQSFIKGAKAGESTMRDYVTKLTKLAKEVKFGDPESSLVEHLSTVENPNTRSNKAFALIRISIAKRCAAACPGWRCRRMRCSVPGCCAGRWTISGMPSATVRWTFRSIPSGVFWPVSSAQRPCSGSTTTAKTARKLPRFSIAGSAMS